MRCEHWDWAKSVATSDDEQQQAMTSSPLIAMVAIDAAFIERRQSACNTSPSNAKRKAEAISFEATSGLANEHGKNVVSAS